MKYIPLPLLLIIIAAGFFIPVPVGAVDSSYLLKVEKGTLFPSLPLEMEYAGTADLDGDTALEWVYYSGPTVKAFHLNRQGRYVLWQEYSFEADVSNLHLADLDGDGASEVIAAYDDIGILDVIGWSDNKWWKSYSRVYLWSRVTSLDTLSLSGFPFRLILTFSEDGAINVLRWNGVNPEIQWSSSKLAGKSVNYSGSGDFDGDGESDFALVVNDSELQIYSPSLAQLTPVWTNFPWGGIAGSEVFDLDGDKQAEVVTASPVGLLYSFEWRSGNYGQKWRFEDLAGIHEGMEQIWLPTSQRLAVISKNRDKLVVWPLDSSGAPQYRAELAVDSDDWRLLGGVGDKPTIGWSADGSALDLAEYPESQTEVNYHLDGMQFTKLRGKVHAGRLWLSLRDLGQIFGLRVNWNDISDLLYLSSERVFMVFDAAEGIVWVNGLPVRAPEIKKIQGNFVLSLPLAEQMFNFSTHWLGGKAYLFPNS